MANCSGALTLGGILGGQAVVFGEEREKTTQPEDGQDLRTRAIIAWEKNLFFVPGDDVVVSDETAEPTSRPRKPRRSGPFDRIDHLRPM